MRRLEPHNPEPNTLDRWTPHTFTQVPIKAGELRFRVEPFLRDTRHLAGSRPTSQTPTGD